MRFRDREDAGQQLAARLVAYRDESPLVLGVPRGGVPVAYEVARALGAPLDIFVSRKIGVPFHPELGLGAFAEGGELVLNEEILTAVGLSGEDVARLAEAKEVEVAQRVRRFRGDRPAPEIRGRTVLLVDDGIATGGTILAAIRAVRRRGPKKLVLAVPVAPADTLENLGSEVDEVVSLECPRSMPAIGRWYRDFAQVTDDEVVELLQRSREPAEAVAPLTP
jgi:putative phosphoribosyl transferase